MRTILVALSLGLACAAAQPADEPAPSSFAWRGTLDTGGQSGLVRAALPAEALVRLQSRDAADLRVFDSGGEPVAFAFARPPRPPAEARQQTAGFRALPLYAAPPGTQAPKGTVQFRVDERGERRSLWVQLGADGARPAPQGAAYSGRARKPAVGCRASACGRGGRANAKATGSPRASNTRRSAASRDCSRTSASAGRSARTRPDWPPVSSVPRQAKEEGAGSSAGSAAAQASTSENAARTFFMRPLPAARCHPRRDAGAAPAAAARTSPPPASAGPRR